MVRAPELSQRYDESWALVIGIDRYEHAPSLRCAVNDADRFAGALVNQLGFAPDKVRVLLDPGPLLDRPYRTIPGPATRTNVERALFAGLGGITENDRFLVFFAGHGLSLPSPAGGDPLGYLVPSDGQRDDLVTLVGMDRLTHELNHMCPAKHAIFVLDCCYGGLATSRELGAAPTYAAKMITKWSRQVMTAGASEEVVRDEYKDGNSLFTYFLLEGLTGTADGNRDGVITATELHAFVQGRVGTEGRGVQLPELANLDDHASGGNFVFVLAPVQFDLASVPTLLPPGPRRARPLPSYLFVEGEAAQVTTARTQIETTLRQLADVSRVESAGPLGDVASRLEGLNALPAGTAEPLTAFMTVLDKVLYGPVSSPTPHDLLSAAHLVIVDLDELLMRARDARAERAEQADQDGPDEDLGGTLWSILTSDARLDDSGWPVFAMGWVRGTPNWRDLAVDDGGQPLTLDRPSQAVIGGTAPDQAALGIGRTPPGSGPLRLMTEPIDATGYPTSALITIVDADGETPVARPLDERTLAFTEAVKTVFARGRNEDGSFRTRYVRAADGELTRVLVDPEGRPVRLWFEELGEVPARLGLGCILVEPDGMVIMVLDDRLRPLSGSLAAVVASGLPPLTSEETSHYGRVKLPADA